MRTRALTCAGIGLMLVPATAGAATVRVRNIAFNPPVTRIHESRSVTWSFQDPHVTHVVASRGQTRFGRSAPKREGDRYRVKFRHRGIYRYACTIHPAMRGRVVVR